MTYYLSAGATKYKGVRYTRGQELPDDLGAKLAERNLAVDDPAKLTPDLRPVMQPAVEPKIEQRSTLGGAQTYAADPDLQARILELEQELEDTRRELDAANAAERARVQAEAAQKPVVAETDGGKVEQTTAEPAPETPKAPAKTSSRHATSGAKGSSSS